MSTNGIELIIMMGNKVVSLAEGCSIPINYESKETPGWKEFLKSTRSWSCKMSDKKEAIMTYYYHRGKKYFFRNSGAKIIVETESFPVQLKYGDEINMEFTTQ